MFLGCDSRGADLTHPRQGIVLCHDLYFPGHGTVDGTVDDAGGRNAEDPRKIDGVNFEVVRALLPTWKCGRSQIGGKFFFFQWHSIGGVTSEVGVRVGHGNEADPSSTVV